MTYSDRLESAMVRSAEAASWPLKVWDDLASCKHMIEDLRRENEVMHLSQPIVEL